MEGQQGKMDYKQHPELRLLGKWTTPNPGSENANTPVEDIYKDGSYPIGKYLNYEPSDDSPHPTYFNKLRHAAEAHRRARRYLQEFIKPGMKLVDVVKRLEAKSLELVGGIPMEDTTRQQKVRLEAGWAFPTGCSLNSCAAHYTPNYGDDTTIKIDDVCKIDFGVHVNGYLVDSAFTLFWNPAFIPLAAATKEATKTVIAAAGPDAILGELGGLAEEVINSYEMEWNGKPLKIQPVENLTGHSIEKYKIHGGKYVPVVLQESYKERMMEGEVFAVETFATTGRGSVESGGECSHYMRSFEKNYVPLKLKKSKELLNQIENSFGTLAFCRRWLDDLGFPKHAIALKHLCDADIIRRYPPLYDVSGSFTSQSEHTILIRKSGCEVITAGEDY